MTCLFAADRVNYMHIVHNKKLFKFYWAPLSEDILNACNSCCNIFAIITYTCLCTSAIYIFYSIQSRARLSLSIKSTHLYKRTKKKSTIERTIVKLHNPSREVLFIHMYVKRKDSCTYVCDISALQKKGSS